MNRAIIGLGNGLAPIRRQAITWTNAELLSSGPTGTNFGQIVIEILIFLFTKLHLKMPFANWRPFYLGLDIQHYKCQNISRDLDEISPETSNFNFLVVTVFADGPVL